MQFHLNKTCDEHPNQEVNYIYQQEMDSLKLGCFNCVTQEKGTFFYNLKHFLHQVEDLLNERLGMYKKGNHFYYEIHDLVNDFKDLSKQQRQYEILEQISSFFEINEENYKLQLATSNQIDKYSNDSHQQSSEQSDLEDSIQMSSHSIKRDFEHELSNSDSEILCPERNMVEFSYKQTVKKLKNQAIAAALDKCQDIKSHDYLPFMNWKQFQQYSQYYINQEFKYFYHIYCENENDHDQLTIFEEYEQKYSPTRADSYQTIQSISSSTSPTQNSQFIIEKNLSQIQNENSRKSSLQIELEKDNKLHEEGRYFHECLECSLIFQQTQDQIDLIQIMFQDIKQILAYKKHISPLMTFCPIQIFWDLRVEF